MTGTPKIEKNIPMPLGGGAKYPFRDMKVGDSIFYDGIDKGLSARQACYQFAKRNPSFQFIGRKNGTGIRIWRIK